MGAGGRRSNLALLDLGALSELSLFEEESVNCHFYGGGLGAIAFLESGQFVSGGG